jgi:hypothetical protein
LGVGNFASLIFFRPVAGLAFDSLSLLFGASPRDFFFLLVPAFLFRSQSVFSSHARRINFRSPRGFIATQMGQFGL